MRVVFEPSDFSTVYTVEELGELLHVKNLRVIHGWLKDGSLKGKKIGRRWLVTRAELKRFVSPEDEKEIELKDVRCPLGIYKCVYCSSKAKEETGD